MKTKLTFLLMLGFAILSMPKSFSQLITVDGKAESAWDAAEERPIARILEGADNIEDADDFSAKYKIMWDNQGIYLLVTVLDDILVNDQTEYFKNDMVEVYFDMDNSKNPLPAGSGWTESSYDDNDFQFTLAIGDAEVGGGPEGADVAFASDLSESGVYVLEYFFHWSDLGLTSALAVGDTIGFDVTVGDNDGGTERQSYLGWNTIDAEAYHDASRFGTLIAQSNNVFSKPEGITIDGKHDPLWADIDRRSIETLIDPDDAENFTGPADFSGYHQVYWDQDAFYVLVHVHDQTLTVSKELETHNVDNIEIYWDMDNSKNPCPGCDWTESSYDDNDYQFQLRIGGELAINGNPADVNVEYAQNIYDGGHIVEFKFPIDEMMAGASYVPGDLVGFDVYITDNDDYTERKGQLSWFDDSGEAYHIASKFGTIELLENGMTEPSNECEIWPPTKPTDLVSENKDASFVISWTASEDNVGVEGYEVYKETSSGDVFVAQVIEPTIEIFDFASGAQIDYKVRAFDACENFSDFSDVLTVTAPEITKYKVVKADEAITIDGKADEAIWDKANWETSTIYKKDDSNDAENEEPEVQDLETTFAMTWDADFLYVFIDVADDNVENWDGTTNDWDTRNVPYQFDCVELCIAGSNERYTSDAGLKEGDTQWRFNTGVSGQITGNPGTVDFGSYNVEFAEGISLRHSGGYTFEIKFPWSAVYRDIDVPANLGVNTEMLFTAITIDNDGRMDGDMYLRDHELAYFDGTGNHWKQTNAYKTMVLADTEGAVSIDDIINKDAITLYPNPASTQININSDLNLSSAFVVDMTGKIAKMVDLGQGKSVSISDLPEGLYTLVCITEDGKQYYSRFVKN